MTVRELHGGSPIYSERALERVIDLDVEKISSVTHVLIYVFSSFSVCVLQTRILGLLTVWVVCGCVKLAYLVTNPPQPSLPLRSMVFVFWDWLCALILRSLRVVLEILLMRCSGSKGTYLGR